jgi:uncharacterized membrane protein
VARLPADIVAVVGLILLTGVAVCVPGIEQTPVPFIVGVPFVLFIPGYALTAALFPETEIENSGQDFDHVGDHHRVASSGVPVRGSIDGIERVALSFGTSVAIVPLLGVGLQFMPWGLQLVPLFFAISGFTVLATVVAVRRRWALPPEARFRVPYQEWGATIRAELFDPETRTDLVLNGLIVVGILLAGAGITYAVTVQKQETAFTEFYILTENETGVLVSEDYPTNYTLGEAKPIHISIGNHEQRQMDYTVVVELQRMQTTNTTRVQTTHELQRVQASVPANRTWRQTVTVTPSMTGQGLRLVFLLYQKDPPAQPRVANAYREVHLGVNVTAMPTVPDHVRSIDNIG